MGRCNELLNTSLAMGEKPYGLLKGVAAFGSINKATKALQMSDSHARRILSRLEEAVGFKLIEKKIGGVSGGGSWLTDAGHRFIERYEQFRSDAADAFDELFPPGQRAAGREEALLTMAEAEEPYRLLKAIETCGSLNKAAGALRKQYCSAWHILNRFEETVGIKLVERKKEGCLLTHAGKRFVEHYERFHAELSRALDGLFRKRLAA